MTSAPEEKHTSFVYPKEKPTCREMSHGFRFNMYLLFLYNRLAKLEMADKGKMLFLHKVKCQIKKTRQKFISKGVSFSHRMKICVARRKICRQISKKIPVFAKYFNFYNLFLLLNSLNLRWILRLFVIRIAGIFSTNWFLQNIHQSWLRVESLMFKEKNIIKCVLENNRIIFKHEKARK